MTLISGIYKITSPTNKIYVGSANDIYQRWFNYKYAACKTQRRLYNSIKKYGWDTHKAEILEECEFKDLYPLERAWGLFYNVLGVDGLNCILPGYEEFKKFFSEETKLKLSISNTGKKHTQESIEKMKIIQRKRSKESRSGRSKLILNLETGIYYNNIVEAIKSLPIKTSLTTLSTMLRNKMINRTNLLYALEINEDLKNLIKEKEERIKTEWLTKKKVINTETGIIYDSAIDANNSLNKPYSMSFFRTKLAGNRPNNTSFKYV